jgi:SAM-dependent methyltransferase
MIAVARRQLRSLGYDEVPFASGDARHLPHPDRSFDAVTCVGLLMHLDAEARVAVLRQLARVSRGRVVVQYGYIHPFNRVRERMTGQVPGNVRYSVGEAELQQDLARGGLAERARFWALRRFSSSVVLVLDKTDAARLPA